MGFETGDGGTAGSGTMLTPQRAVITDTLGALTTSVTTATEISYVSGVTSSIQTQLNGKQPTGNYITALTGDVSASGPGSVTATIQPGVVDNGKLANGAVDNNKVAVGAAIARSKLANGTANHVVINDAGGVMSSEAQLALSRGGTNKNNAAVNGAIAYSDATGIGLSAAGTSGQWLQSAGAAAPIWVGSAAAKVAAYNILITDDVITGNVSGGTFALTLPTAVGIAGKRFTIKRTDQTLGTSLTVNTTSSQTIDGATSTTLETQYETIVVMSDGANWLLISRDYPRIFTSYTPSNTQGFGTITAVNLQWMRNGNLMIIQGGFTSGTVSASMAQIELPSSLVIGGATSARVQCGNLTRSTAGPQTVLGVQGRTYLSFGGGASSQGDVPGNSLVGSTEILLMSCFAIPITNWK